ncbi:MAG: DUF5816 domain-containing protein [Halobacteriaceae archaeon]
MESRTGPDGTTLFIDREAGERGSKGPFLVVYRDASRDRRWGYLCGNCDSLDTAMDTMGRVSCTACGNLRKPDEWDAAHE